MSGTRAARRPKIQNSPATPTGSRERSWLVIATVILSAICLVGLFSTEIADTDFWWHLKTGQYLVQQHALPVPDPFAYTTAIINKTHPGDQRIQNFNLTHEWLAQAFLYIVYVIGGFPLIIITRACLLAGMCGLSGFLSARLTNNFYIGLAASFATASVAIEFRSDRPALLTFLLVAVFVTLLELRYALWALPVLQLVWANSHGGFFLGWIVLLCYCVEFRAKDRRRLWTVTALSIAVSGLNPNGFGVLATLVEYRRSAMTASLFEWHRPYLWGPPYAFDILLYVSAFALLVSWRRVRLAHWALYAAFAGASLTAFRNIPLLAFFAPVVISVYLVPRIAEAVPGLGSLIRRPVAWAAPVALVIATAIGLSTSSFFQLHVGEWTIPAGAADFMLANHITGRMFNTWSTGGYLMWRLWPQERVFIDGRALSEALNDDYQAILNNLPGPVDQITGRRAELLNRYGIEVVAMNSIEWISGGLFPLVTALGRPESTDWQLVYEDTEALVFMKNPPPGIPAIPNKIGRVLLHFDKECSSYIEHSPGTPYCARALFDFWMRSQQPERARNMLRLYLLHEPEPDPIAEEWWRKFVGGPLPRR